MLFKHNIFALAKNINSDFTIANETIFFPSIKASGNFLKTESTLKKKLIFKMKLLADKIKQEGC